MSWKSLVTAGLLCVLASPAFAVPSLSITNGGLNAQGNWIWNVSVTPTASGTPVAVELGLRDTVATSSIKTVDRTEANFDTLNPGTKIFTWENTTDLGGGNIKPVGLQANCTGCTVDAGGVIVAGTLDEVFAALGSVDFASAGAKDVLQVTTTGPTASSLTTSLQLLGKYGTGSTNGRVAEITGAAATNYSNFSGTASRTVKAGDINLSGLVDFNDAGILATNINQNGKNWSSGDLTGNGLVDFNDAGILATNINQSGGSTTNLNINGVAGGSGSSVGAVPEPASIALFGLAILGGLGLIGRKR